MAISKAKARSVKHAVLAGDEQSTDTIDATHTSQTVELTGPASKVSVQGTGDLAFNVSFSINGTDFFGTTAAAAITPVSYNTHNVSVVKIDRTSGSGRVAIIST